MPRPARNRSRSQPASRGARPASQGRGPAKGAARGRLWHGVQKLPVVGLVGGIGAGKSTVAAALAERGAVVLDADAIGHALLDQTPSRELVVERFGEGVLDPTDPSRVDRKALGAIVFADPAALKDLERILHPRMRRTFEKAIARASRRSAQAVVLDAAILFEAGWDDLCDLVVFVDSPRDVRLARLAESRGWTAEQLEARERAQLALDEKRSRADMVVRNDGDASALGQDIEALWGRVRPRLRTRPSPPPDRPPPDGRPRDGGPDQ